LDIEQLKLGFLWYIIFIFSLVLHEFAHAFAAFKLGDRTAFEAGQVSLNPIPHMQREVFGTIIVPIISFILGGWMIGWASTPFDYKWAEKNMEKSAIMSLAGPAANLALIILAVVLIRIAYAADIFYAPDSIDFSHITASNLGGLYSSIGTFLSILFSLNVILMFFNLLPLPTFDGSSILIFFVKGEQARKVFEVINNPRFAFFSLIIAWNVFDYIFGPIHLFAINLLYPGVSYS
jgi:Zn-dependent protease